jgi:phage tail-like protein
VQPNQPPSFDGKQRGCVWHRLLLDGCIPPETSVEVWTRANDSLDLLERMPFMQEPPLYRRGGGAEIPFYTPFPDAGTWELLFQAATGRYIQIKLVLRGNLIATPQIQTLRIYYPRFSYPQRYLPMAYQEDRESAAFLERLLANPEGLYSEIEGKITLVGSLFDPRIAPAEALDWLAGWWGLVLDPLWAGLQQRRQKSGQPTVDRRRLFIRFARKLYDRRGTVDGMQFALHLLLDPCLEQSFQALKAAATRNNPAIRAELQRLGLPYPTPVMSEAQLEDLLYNFVLAPSRASKVRIVERFLTRNGRALVAGDPTPQGVGVALAADAHSFSVLIPDQLAAEEAAMVTRIITMEKPAHTRFDVRRYFDYFRVGEARLGIDTTLGEDSRFVAIVLGDNYLSSGYLAAAPPMDSSDRVIADRDRLGRLPAL